MTESLNHKVCSRSLLKVVFNKVIKEAMRAYLTWVDYKLLVLGELMKTQVKEGEGRAVQISKMIGSTTGNSTENSEGKMPTKEMLTKLTKHQWPKKTKINKPTTNKDSSRPHGPKWALTVSWSVARSRAIKCCCSWTKLDSVWNNLQ